MFIFVGELYQCMWMLWRANHKNNVLSIESEIISQEVGEILTLKSFYDIVEKSRVRGETMFV